MRRSLALLALLILAGCGGPEGPTETVITLEDGRVAYCLIYEGAKSDELECVDGTP